MKKILWKINYLTNSFAEIYKLLRKYTNVHIYQNAKYQRKQITIYLK